VVAAKPARRWPFAVTAFLACAVVGTLGWAESHRGGAVRSLAEGANARASHEPATHLGATGGGVDELVAKDARLASVPAPVPEPSSTAILPERETPRRTVRESGLVGGAHGAGAKEAVVGHAGAATFSSSPEGAKVEIPAKAVELAVPTPPPPEPAAPPPPVMAREPPPGVPPTPPPPAAPAFDPTTASVRFGTPTAVQQTGSSSVSQALAHARGAATQCYRAALPSLSPPVEGTATLHIETDDSGTIVRASVTGAVRGAVAPCIEDAVRGLRVSGVDTGAASADIPLEFKAR
jgi:hypothetical protein